MTRRGFLSSCALAAGSVSAAAATERKTKYLILVTSDGLRWQDLFTGIDPLLMNEKSAGMAEAAGLRSTLWRETPEFRRVALMPFFWGKLVRRGVILGNVNKGSSVQVANRYRVSYPGYSELLTGRTQDEVIRGNDPVQNPAPSIFQFLKDRWKLGREQAAVFGSWDEFHYISQTKRGEIFVNAGYEEWSIPEPSPRVAELNKLQTQARYLEDSARHDAFTFGLAMEYLKQVQPRLLYIALDETDDWAHAKRYDRVLQTIQVVDDMLEDLWLWVQNSPKYRDATTLIFTCDHGRGGKVEDWHGHGPDVPGDEQIWVFAIGPDTPAAGEVTNSPVCYQRDIAPTALEMLGVDYTSYPGVQGKPIAALLK